ncbi:hypothetical protein [Streptomyces sp. LN245]|uniref:hypothetical protein n=1 Tax=Streptomyces sp. LN245 TaxID=3112975 RepID=UPI00371B7167
MLLTTCGNALRALGRDSEAQHCLHQAAALSGGTGGARGHARTSGFAAGGAASVHVRALTG